jgi:hypothetical protein
MDGLSLGSPLKERRSMGMEDCSKGTILEIRDANDMGNALWFSFKNYVVDEMDACIRP